MIVSDTNLIAYLLISGERTSSADDVFTKDSEWAAPLLWRSDFRNVLALHVRQRLLTLNEAISAFTKAEELLRGHEHQVDSEAVLRLSGQSGCSAYDAEFVFVAQELNVPLVTSDQKALQAFPMIAVSPEDFAS